jgi:hypothetical protein
MIYLVSTKYERRKAAGLCTRCGARPATPEGQRCSPCREYQRAYAARWCALQSTRGLCTSCRIRPASSGHRTCNVCRTYAREHSRGRDAGRRVLWRTRGLCTLCGNPATPGYRTCDACRTVVRTTNKHARERVHDAVFAHYGGSCVCCGEANPVFLVLDHIAGDGKQHREKLGGNFYNKLRRAGYPLGLQVLCANCHIAKHRNETCPHKS